MVLNVRYLVSEGSSRGRVVVFVVVFVLVDGFSPKIRGPACLAARIDTGCSATAARDQEISLSLCNELQHNSA